jgi:phage protein D
LAEGNEIEVSWGYLGNYSPARTCVITSVQGSLQLSVEANAKSVIMNRLTKARVFEGLSYSEIAAQIAEEYGYDESAQFIDDTGAKIEVVAQARLTDAQFLRSLANKLGFEFFVDFDGLHFHERKIGQKPIKRFVWYTSTGDPGAGRPAGEILKWSVKTQTKGGKGSVVAKGRDPLKKETHTSEVSNATETDRPTNAGVSLVPSPKDGGLTKNTAGESVIPSSEADQVAGKQTAQGVYRKSQQGTVILSMSCIGDPQLVAKSAIEVLGISQAFSGNYFVQKVTHDVGSGYQMAVEANRTGKNITLTPASVKNKGELNDQKASANDTGALEPVLVAGEGGALVTKYRDTRGRDK